MMTEQNGIDILCDAAGSDLLLSDCLAPSPTVQQPAKRPRLATDSSSAGPSHVCQICKRLYERADHLTRHLRSHENARPYQCTRCPKRFNRADLLTRHETTHDRDDGATGRPTIRRGDRAGQACLNCASSKAKCDDQKPCGRCRIKNLVCQTASRRLTSGEIDAHSAMSTSDSLGSTSQSGIGTGNTAQTSLAMDHRMPYPSTEPAFTDQAVVAASCFQDQMAQPTPRVGGTTDDAFGFNSAVHTFQQDMDFSAWDLDFDSCSIPQLAFSGLSPSPQAFITFAPKQTRSMRDPSRGHAAFKRSPWLWEPEAKDNLVREQEGLVLNEETISNSPAYEKMLASTSARLTMLKMESTQRDRLFAIVLSERKDPLKIPSFPSLNLLNYLLQTHFVQDDYQTDSWIHAASFDPSVCLPELLAALIASGAVLFAVPAIWQFGLALLEVARMALSSLVRTIEVWLRSSADCGQFESNNAHTRDIQALQAFMLNLDIGLWSGFKRKMEIAESFLQPLMTMLRRAGMFSAPIDTPALIPSQSDSPVVLDSKWRSFIKRESYKRLTLHLFIHDAQSSVGLQKNPLMSYTELGFSLPASRDLWKAATAEIWRENYLRKRPLSSDATIPRVSEILHCTTLLDTLEDFVDVELCYSAMLYGFWGQIHTYREAVKFYSAGLQGSHRNATHRLWIISQHQELYRDIRDFATHIESSPKLAPQFSVVAELFMMILHVSPDDIQRFAGKYGEEEARRAAVTLEDGWARIQESRYAVWHAGQVFRISRLLPPASLRGFNAIAVYLASLTLWAYGILSCSHSTQAQDNHEISPPSKYVQLDGDESRDVRAFLQLDKGVPIITRNGDVNASTESLSNPGMVLDISRNLFRSNYPVINEPLPPLVESLRNLLMDLGTGLAGRPSRVPSRAVSEDRQ
ncbi:uncharacterized protein BCR38DRAFT_387781 [Pseudomassariella vexata]|uniref:Uncharacterized protein n=1 Tax=Pseudomassariella vexata TaxID=1141098 RepID=A0A1Y2E708_9PEZI|nr:uncharacterized protein BCR38DRAFT_387781 [Pseudomassariella vexata]ORY67299.1 hypothetical protein BCR38DRAFT_387781 [Pseudomassariella vexata]